MISTYCQRCMKIPATYENAIGKIFKLRVNFVDGIYRPL